MKPKHIYIVMCILGVMVPYAALMPWVAEHGMDMRLMYEQATATNIAMFGWLDAIMTAFTLFVFAAIDGGKAGAKMWAPPIVATFAVGVSLGLPLYLLLRELRRERSASP